MHEVRQRLLSNPLQELIYSLSHPVYEWIGVGHVMVILGVGAAPHRALRRISLPTSRPLRIPDMQPGAQACNIIDAAVLSGRTIPDELLTSPRSSRVD